MEQDVQLPTTLSGLEVEVPTPSSEAVYIRAKAMTDESSGNVDFINKIIMLFIGNIGYLVRQGIRLAFFIAMIVIGAKYKDDCPAERYIPIYLIVAGCFGVLRNSITIVRRCCQKKEENTRKVNTIESIIDVFMFAWFIAGSVWIYRTNGEFSTTPGDSSFCDPTLYWLAFSITTGAYLGLGCDCLCGLFAMCLGSDSK